MQIQGGLAPLRDGLGTDHLILAGEVGGYAKSKIGGADRHYGVEEMVVAIGRFDENLCLMIFQAHRLQLFETSLSIRLLHRKIPMESKILTAQSGGHKGQHDGGGTHQRHHLDAQSMCLGHHEMSGVGYARHPRIGEKSHMMSLQTGLQELLHIQRLVVFIEMKEGEVVDGGGDAQRLQKTAFGAHIFYDVVIDFVDNLTVESGENPVESGFSQRGRNEVE